MFTRTDMNNMEFRRLTASDLESLLELYKQLDADDDMCPSDLYKKVWNEIEDDENIRYFGAVEDGKVLSTCYAVYIPNLTRGGRGICFVENVVTDKEYRRHGLSSKVLDMAIEFAKEHGCYKVILQSSASRADAHQFYINKGFNGESKKAFDMRL